MPWPTNFIIAIWFMPIAVRDAGLNPGGSATFCPYGLKGCAVHCGAGLGWGPWEKSASNQPSEQQNSRDHSDFPGLRIHGRSMLGKNERAILRSPTDAGKRADAILLLLRADLS